jgi:hypothetical protein
MKTNRLSEKLSTALNEMTKEACFSIYLSYAAWLITMDLLVSQILFAMQQRSVTTMKILEYILKR